MLSVTPRQLRSLRLGRYWRNPTYFDLLELMATTPDNVRVVEITAPLALLVASGADHSHTTLRAAANIAFEGGFDYIVKLKRATVVLYLMDQTDGYQVVTSKNLLSIPLRQLVFHLADLVGQSVSFSGV